jgi:hypothetical protein
MADWPYWILLTAKLHTLALYFYQQAKAIAPPSFVADFHQASSEADCGQGDHTPGHEIQPVLGKDRAPASSGLIIDVGKGWRVGKIALENRGRGCCG